MDNNLTDPKSKRKWSEETKKRLRLERLDKRLEKQFSIPGFAKLYKQIELQQNSHLYF